MVLDKEQIFVKHDASLLSVQKESNQTMTKFVLKSNVQDTQMP